MAIRVVLCSNIYPTLFPYLCSVQWQIPSDNQSFATFYSFFSTSSMGNNPGKPGSPAIFVAQSQGLEIVLNRDLGHFSRRAVGNLLKV